MRIAPVEFAAAHLGSAGLPLLIDAASRSKDRKARHRAVQAVAKLGAAKQVDWVTSLALDLKQLDTCQARCRVVERLRQLGDPGALGALRRARDATVRYMIFRKAWRNGCCRDRIVRVIRELKKKRGKS